MSQSALAELAARFISGAQIDAQRLEQALKSEDFDAIERIAHSMAGAAGIFGLTDIGAAALAIDDRFANGTRPAPEMVETLIARVRDHS